MGRREAKRKSRSDPKTHPDGNSQVNHSRPPPDQTFHLSHILKQAKLTVGEFEKLL
jgi:hypothetical protein